VIEGASETMRAERRLEPVPPASEGGARARHERGHEDERDPGDERKEVRTRRRMGVAASYRRAAVASRRDAAPGSSGTPRPIDAGPRGSPALRGRRARIEHEAIAQLTAATRTAARHRKPAFARRTERDLVERRIAGRAPDACLLDRPAAADHELDVDRTLPALPTARPG
jgi:hypothetical protein